MLTNVSAHVIHYGVPFRSKLCIHNFGQLPVEIARLSVREDIVTFRYFLRGRLPFLLIFFPLPALASTPNTERFAKNGKTTARIDAKHSGITTNNPESACHPRVEIPRLSVLGEIS